MLSKSVVRVRIPPLLDTTTYLSLVVMSLLAVRGLQTLQAQLVFLGLSAAFGLLYRFVFRAGHYEKNPAIYFGAQLIVLALMLVLGTKSIDAINFIFLIASLHAALVLTRKAASVWIAVYYITVSAVTFIRSGANGYYAAAFYFVAYVVIAFFGYILQQAELARQHNQQLIEELQSAQQKLRELAVIEERNRLARELHDSVKQQVFAVSMQLGAARALLNEGNQAYGPVIEAERLARQAGAELTTLIRELRPAGLESKTLAEALQEYVTAWSRQNGIAADLKMDGVSSIPLAGDETLFRVAQEALANVARHSNAGHVTMELANKDDEIVLMVEDDGVGFDMSQVEKGVGLDSMRERLEAIGGHLSIHSEKSSGTRVMAAARRS